MSNSTSSAQPVPSGETAYQAFRSVIGRGVRQSDELLLLIENALRREQGFRTELETPDALKRLDANAAAYVVAFLSSATFQRTPDIGRAIASVAEDVKKLAS